MNNPIPFVYPFNYQMNNNIFQFIERLEDKINNLEKKVNQLETKFDSYEDNKKNNHYPSNPNDMYMI